ncbi:hypothetical protein H7J86_24425 [Mycobacterium hackensackense]|nr:hypothetical protein [Mycobacterium hackensackense]
MRRAFALLREGKVDKRNHRLAVCSYVTWRTIDSTDDLSTRDIRAVVDTLEYWKHLGEIEYRCRRIAESMVVAS